MTAFRSSMITAAAFSLTGCMLSPTDDGRVASVTDSLPFEGFVTAPSAPVQVRAWDFTANAMADVGAPVLATATPTAVSGGPLYLWDAPRVLPAQFWRTGPAGGQCAAVGAQTTVDGNTGNVITVESDWGRCFNDNPTVAGFFEHCQSNHSPVAMIYTTSWGSLIVNQALLNLAGTLASRQIRLTLDNFTPIQGQFCNASNPAGCPPGLSADPESYQFYAPNASSLSQTGQPPLTFSITPSRIDPFTAYIDNMSSRGVDFTTTGNQFVLGINFESVDPEIRLNCIRDFRCAFTGNPTLELESPRATIKFTLAATGGKIIYTDVSATFSTSSTDGNALAAAAAIGTAMTEKLTNEPAIHDAISAALDSVLRQISGLGALPVDGVTVGGGTVQVRPGCPLD